MKNKLSDLHNHLFMQLERLSDETLKAEQLQVEIERAKAISGVAKDITSNANLVLNAQKFHYEATGQKPVTPEFLELGHVRS